MGYTNFFNQEETNEGIIAEEEQMLQRLQKKKQKIESQRASMIQRSSSIKKPYQCSKILNPIKNKRTIIQ